MCHRSTGLMTDITKSGAARKATGFRFASFSKTASATRKRGSCYRTSGLEPSGIRRQIRRAPTLSRFGTYSIGQCPFQGANSNG